MNLKSTILFALFVMCAPQLVQARMDYIVEGLHDFGHSKAENRDASRKSEDYAHQLYISKGSFKVSGESVVDEYLNEDELSVGHYYMFVSGHSVWKKVSTVFVTVMFVEESGISYSVKTSTTFKGAWDPVSGYGSAILKKVLTQDKLVWETHADKAYAIDHLISMGWSEVAHSLL